MLSIEVNLVLLKSPNFWVVLCSVLDFLLLCKYYEDIIFLPIYFRMVTCIVMVKFTPLHVLVIVMFHSDLISYSPRSHLTLHFSFCRTSQIFCENVKYFCRKSAVSFTGAGASDTLATGRIFSTFLRQNKCWQ